MKKMFFAASIDAMGWQSVGKIRKNWEDEKKSALFFLILNSVPTPLAPAAIALATLLRLRPGRTGRTGRAWPWLVLFALASPAGLVAGNYLVPAELLRGGLFAALLGLVAGSFLHVSTTILFETSPEHTLNWPKLAATLMGLALALAVT